MRKIKKPVFFIVLVCILAFAYLTYAGIHTYWGDTRKTYIKGVDEIRWGIDIQGGVNAIFEPNLDEGQSLDDITSDQMDAAKAIIEQRLVSLNITDSEVYADNTKKRIMVSFPWQAGEEDFDPEEAVSELGETAQLVFVKGTDAPTGPDDPNIVLTGEDVKKAEAGYHQDQTTGQQTFVVSLELESSGKQAFADATTELAGTGKISIWMLSGGYDNISETDCISAPNVNTPITDGSCEISGNFTYDEAKSLADKINAGALPFNLQTTSTNIISATMGEGAKNAMVLAGIIAFCFIAVYMIVIYRLPGFVASIALFGQAFGTLAFISGFFKAFESFTLTIPGIAGIILAIGMGVDANVITAERIKEELNNGKTLNGAIELGYKRAWSAVFDGNITVVFVAVILMGAFGPTDSLFGVLLKPLFMAFGASTAGTIYSLGYTLLIGILLNFFFGIFCSRLMLASLSKFKCFKKRSFYGGIDLEKIDKTEKKEKKNLQVVKNSKKFYGISCALFAVFIVLTFVIGLNVDIQFKGGTILTYSYEGTISSDEVKSSIGELVSDSFTVTLGENTATKKTTIKIQISSREGISDDAQNEIATKLKETFPDNSIELFESNDVSASNGLDFFLKCLVAVIFAMIVTIIYIGFRFRKIGGISAGVFSVVALAHDLIMVYGSFVICRFSIDANFMAVLLTILGYSINATIIIYDRIRENQRLYGKKVQLEELVNMSVTQTLGRSVHTTVTTIAAMAVVCIVCVINNVSSIMSFSFPLIIGMLAGVYSSNCIAPTLWVRWRRHQEAVAATGTKNGKKGKTSQKSGRR